MAFDICLDCDVSTCFLRSRVASSDATPGLKNVGVGFVEAPDDPGPGPSPDPDGLSVGVALPSRLLSFGSDFGKGSDRFGDAPAWLLTRTPLTFSLLRGESPQVDRDCWASV